MRKYVLPYSVFCTTSKQSSEETISFNLRISVVLVQCQIFSQFTAKPKNSSQLQRTEFEICKITLHCLRARSQWVDLCGVFLLSRIGPTKLGKYKLEPTRSLI